VQTHLINHRIIKQENNRQQQKGTTSTSMNDLWGVLGTFRGGFGGVDPSLGTPQSRPRAEGEKGDLGDEYSVLNRKMFLLGLIADPALPAEEKGDPKSGPNNSCFNNLV